MCWRSVHSLLVLSGVTCRVARTHCYVTFGSVRMLFLIVSHRPCFCALFVVWVEQLTANFLFVHTSTFLVCYFTNQPSSLRLFQFGCLVLNFLFAAPCTLVASHRSFCRCLQQLYCFVPAVMLPLDVARSHGWHAVFCGLSWLSWLICAVDGILLSCCTSVDDILPLCSLRLLHVHARATLQHHFVSFVRLRAFEPLCGLVWFSMLPSLVAYLFVCLQ